MTKRIKYTTVNCLLDMMNCYFFVQSVDKWLSVADVFELRACSHFLNQIWTRTALQKETCRFLWSESITTFELFPYIKRLRIPYNTSSQINIPTTLPLGLEHLYTDCFAPQFTSLLKGLRLKTLDMGFPTVRRWTMTTEFFDTSYESLVNLSLPIATGPNFIIEKLPPNLCTLFLQSYVRPLKEELLSLSSLSSLQFGINYNQPINVNVLPSSLTKLNLGYDFNHPLAPGVLPINLRVLRLSKLFNQPLEIGSLPSSLTELIFGMTYTYPLLPGIIPHSVRYLELTTSYSIEDVNIWPSSLQRLRLYYNGPCDISLPFEGLSKLPNSLTTVILSHHLYAIVYKHFKNKYYDKEMKWYAYEVRFTMIQQKK